MQCHKCNAEMEKGFILDEEYGSAYPLRWIEGDPGKSTLWRKLRGVIKRNKRKIEFAKKLYFLSRYVFTT